MHSFFPPCIFNHIPNSTDLVFCDPQFENQSLNVHLLNHHQIMVKDCCFLLHISFPCKYLKSTYITLYKSCVNPKIKINLWISSSCNLARIKKRELWSGMQDKNLKKKLN